MNSTSEGVLVRFLKGRIPLSTSFWLVFVPVYVVLLIGARPIGAWWGGLAAEFDRPLLFPMFVMFLIGLVVALGAGASAWRVRGLFGSLALIVILFVAGAYVYGGFRTFISVLN